MSDNTDPGVSSAKKKVTAFDEANKKTKKRLDEMNKTKWKVAVEAVDKVTSVISKIGKTVKGVAGKAWSFTVSAIDKVTQPVKKMISVMGDLLGVSSAVSTVLAGLTVKNALQASADMARMQAQLKVSAGNMGINESGIDAIIKKAEAMQKTTMYTDEAMVGSAAELATYFDDVDAITRMMLSDEKGYNAGRIDYRADHGWLTLDVPAHSGVLLSRSRTRRRKSSTAAPTWKRSRSSKVSSRRTGKAWQRQWQTPRPVTSRR